MHLGKAHFHFYLHCLIKQRNMYIERLYTGIRNFSNFLYSVCLQRAVDIMLLMKMHALRTMVVARMIMRMPRIACFGRAVAMTIGCAKVVQR